MLDPTGRLVLSRNVRGLVGVASARGGEPHLLLGQGGRGLAVASPEGQGTADLLVGQGGLGPVAVSPDGQWVASGGEDGTIRLWPMPDLSKPPLHTLPHDELLARLRSLTNLQAVRDPDAPTGWRIEAGPFAGWEKVPEW
jgi:WD40 repeat protein